MSAAVDTSAGGGARSAVTLTLDRPDRGNALSAELVARLHRDTDDAIAAASASLVLRGAGRHFCTGFDLSDLESQSDGDLLLRFVRVEQLLATLWAAPLPVLAFAQGRCWGAGADLFCTAQQRWAAPDANFRFPGAAFGLVLGTRRLAERVGADRAREWVVQGVEVDAAQALAAGLVSRIASADEFDAHLEKLATAAPVVDARTRAALFAASRDPQADRDLAALVSSAARPGLRERILAYQQRVKAAR